jgi:hypothetical protein
MWRWNGGTGRSPFQEVRLAPFPRRDEEAPALVRVAGGGGLKSRSRPQHQASPAGLPPWSLRCHNTRHRLNRHPPWVQRQAQTLGLCRPLRLVAASAAGKAERLLALLAGNPAASGLRAGDRSRLSRTWPHRDDPMIATTTNGKATLCRTIKLRLQTGPRPIPVTYLRKFIASAATSARS